MATSEQSLDSINQQLIADGWMPDDQGWTEPVAEIRRLRTELEQAHKLKDAAYIKWQQFEKERDQAVEKLKVARQIIAYVKEDYVVDSRLRRSIQDFEKETDHAEETQ